MKRIQRLLVFVLITILLTCGFTAADGAAEAEYAQAAKRVSALRISIPNTDGTPAMHKTVQKYQAAVLFAEAMTGKTDLAFWNTPAKSALYADVTAYGGAVDYMVKRGVISGTDETVYGYTDSVTYQEMLAIAVRVLGYETEDMVYPQDHIFAAEKLGLSDGITVDTYTKAVTFGETMQLLWNMLCTEVAVVDSVTGKILYPGEVGMMGDISGTIIERYTLLEESGFALGMAESVVWNFVEADDEDDVDTVDLGNGWEIAAADIGITVDTPKVSYLGLPVTLYFDCPAEDFATMYAAGEASIAAYDYAEYTTVTNLGDEGNIRCDIGQKKLFIGEDVFSLADCEVLIYCFGDYGWEQIADPYPVLESFMYDYGYVGASSSNVYGQMAYRVTENWNEDTLEEKQRVEILYTPYEFGQYIERDLTYAVTSDEETFTLIGKYTEDAVTNLDDETTNFKEYFLGNDYTPSTAKVSKVKGELSLNVTVEGEDIESGDFMFYSYNEVDNILTVAENWGTIRTGRLTATSRDKGTMKIDGVNYTFGFGGLYPDLKSYNNEEIYAIINALEEGADNVKYVAKENNLAFYAPLESAETQASNNFAIVSFDADLMSALLDITVTEYSNELVDGFYLTDGYVTAAFLDTATGEWGIGYIETVALSYDLENGEFADLIDVATFAKYAEITTQFNNAEKYAAAKALLMDNALHMVVSAENGVYSLAYIDTENANGVMVSRCNNSDGLLFNANGVTAPITASSDADAINVSTTGSTVLVAIGTDGVAVRTGVQSEKNSLAAQVVYFSANENLIVLTVDAGVAAWGEAPSSMAEETFYLVLPDFSVEIASHDKLTVEGLLDLKDLSVAEPLVVFGHMDTVEVLYGELEPGAVLLGSAEGEVHITDRDVAAAMAELRSDDWIAASVEEFIDSESITVKDGDTEIINASNAIVGIDAQVVTVDLTGANWDHYAVENLFVTELYDASRYDGVPAIVAWMNDDYYEYYQYPFKPDETDVCIAEPALGIFSQFDLDMNGREVYYMDPVYEEAIPMFIPELYTIASFDADTETLQLCVLKLLLPLEASACRFGGWVRYSTQEHARRCSCGMTEFAAHTYGGWTETVAATAESTGVKVRTCTECGQKQSAEIPALNVALISTEDVIGRVGHTVEVDVFVRSDKGFGGMEFTVAFDPALLSLESVELATAFSAFTVTPAATANASGKIAFCFADTQNMTSSGKLATLIFEVPEGTAEGTAALTLTCSKEAPFYYEGQTPVDLAFETIDGSVRICDYMPGDVYEDDTISIRDALLILQHVAYWDVDIREVAADVNCDGKINIRDAAMILQYIAGWDVVLGEAPVEAVKFALRATETLLLKVSGAKAALGESFTVDVTVADNCGFSGLQFSVAFDKTQLKLVAIDQADALASFTATPVEIANANGEIVFCYTSLNDVDDNGKIASLTFTVADSAANGSLPLALDVSDAFILNGESITDISAVTENGKVTIGITKGDVNENGALDIRDVMLILRAVLNDEILTTADMNGDGMLTLLDVLRVMKGIA